MDGGSLFLSIIVGIFGLLIWFFIMRAAVKSGTLAALREYYGGQSPVVSDGSIIRNKEDIVICRRCGSFKKKDGYCPTCGSGWAGKKLSQDIWDALIKLAEERNESKNSLLREMEACKNCGVLKSKGKASFNKV